MAARRRVRISRHPHTCQRVRGGANSVLRQVQTARAAAQPSRHPRPRLGRCNHNRPCLRPAVKRRNLSLSQLPGRASGLARARRARIVRKDRAKRLVSSRSSRITLRRGLGSSSPRAKKIKGRASAPAEHHVRAALREEGIGSVLSRFKRFFSLVSLDVGSRYTQLNIIDCCCCPWRPCRPCRRPAARRTKKTGARGYMQSTRPAPCARSFSALLPRACRRRRHPP